LWVRAAAIQLETVVADVEANLESCERLGDVAAAAGADWNLERPRAVSPARR
jgi:predicted amidohydrolase